MVLSMLIIYKEKQKASGMIQNQERLSTYMERFVRNDESGMTSRPVYGRYHTLLMKKLNKNYLI